MSHYIGNAVFGKIYCRRAVFGVDTKGLWSVFVTMGVEMVPSRRDSAGAPASIFGPKDRDLVLYVFIGALRSRLEATRDWARSLNETV